MVDFLASLVLTLDIRKTFNSVETIEILIFPPNFETKSMEIIQKLERHIVTIKYLVH